MSQSIDHHQLIKTLGRAGLIPFVLLALMVWLLIDNDLQPFVATALACYAAIIASFLGGVHWGAAWVHSEAGSSHRDEHQVPALWWGISAPLLAWPGSAPSCCWCRPGRPRPTSRWCLRRCSVCCSCSRRMPRD